MHNTENMNVRVFVCAPPFLVMKNRPPGKHEEITVIAAVGMFGYSTDMEKMCKTGIGTHAFKPVM